MIFLIYAWKKNYLKDEYIGELFYEEGGKLSIHKIMEIQKILMSEVNSALAWLNRNKATWSFNRDTVHRKTKVKSEDARCKQIQPLSENQRNESYNLSSEF